MGGPIALLTWRRHPDHVAGMVLCATAARFVGRRPAERMWAQGVLGLSVAATLAPASLRRRAMARIVSNRLDGTDLTDWSNAELARNDPAALLRAGALLASFDAAGWLPTIDVPCAVVVTEEDQIVPRANQLALAQGIPGGEVFGVAGDHGVCVSDVERFVPVLIAACQSVARRVVDGPSAQPGRPVTT